MRSRDLGKWSVIGLVVLGLVAAALSLLALRSTREVTAEPAAPGQSTPAVTGNPVEPETPSASAPVGPPASEMPSAEPTEVETPSEPPVDEGPTVVVIGDSNSIGDDTWIATAAEELGWGEVVNLSSPGRGYLATPRECDFEPCANFGGSIGPIADAEPDVVVTFGGVADGDIAIGGPAASYFEGLRDALPDAQLVGISPVTAADEAAYWLTLHGRSISAGLDAVDGVFVNAGQPGVGDGESLSEEAQSAIAAAVVEALG